VNLLDLIIVVVAGAAAVGGYRMGFLRRAISWLGMGLGLYLAARLLPTIVELVGGSTDDLTRLLVAVVVLVSGAFIGQALGLLIGNQLRTKLPQGPARGADKAVGALLGILGVLITVWFLLPAMAGVKGSAARLARSSSIASAIDSTLPPPPDALQSLRSLVGDADFPRVFEGLYRAPEAGPPPEESGLSQAVLNLTTASTVRVEGKACSRIQDGSGWVVATDTVVTNAHVVAGERTTEVIKPNRSRVKATVTLFDANRDLAILSAPGLGLRPLELVDSTVEEGATGAVLGHPGGQVPIAVAPSKVNRRVDAVGRDLYDRRSTTRDVFILASRLAPGYSGGPFVTTSGKVAGVAFAIAPDRDGVAYALTDTEVREALRANRTTAQSTGPCLAG
jgi:S1-C subfamily serine protease